MVNIAKRHSETDGPDFLRQAFARVHKRLAFELMHAAETITHDGERGRSTENDWLAILRSYLPRRYAVDGGIAVDSLGRTSDQIDVIIFDQQYTPALLETATIRLIPAEAIYAVFDAKPEISGTTLSYAADKAASVRRLKRTSVPIVHAGGTFPAKPVLPIIGGILAERVGWKDGFGNSFAPQVRELATDPLRKIDCGCGLSHGAFDIFDGDDRPALGRQDAGLVFFMFRLLNKLQSLGTVPAIDWNAYAALLDIDPSE
jgi:hypothetical protein